MKSKSTLSKLLKDTRFRSIINKFKKKKEISDIILFGSIIRGKDNPNDIDILVLYKKRIDLTISHDLRKELKDFKAQITSKTKKSYLSENFKAREEIFMEGYSLLTDKYLASKYGLKELIIFKYKLGGKNKSDRMRFYHALNGRENQEGIIVKYNLIKFSDTVLLCPIHHSEDLKEFLEVWNIKYKSYPILIPDRIVKSFTISLHT